MLLLMLYGILGMVFLGMRMKRRYEDGSRAALREMEDAGARFWHDRLTAHHAEMAGDGDAVARLKVEAARHARRTHALAATLHREYRDAAQREGISPSSADVQMTRMLQSLARTLDAEEVEIAAALAADARPEGAAPPPAPQGDPGTAISLYGGGLLGSAVGVGIALYLQGRAFDATSGETMLIVVTSMFVTALAAAVFRERFWVAVAWMAYVAFHVWSRPGPLGRRSWREFRREWRPHW